MKIFISRFFSALFIAAAFVFCGCASKPIEGNAHPDWMPQPHVNKNPHVGMTQSEVLRFYGRPNSIINTQSGQTWQYNNFAKMWIPFNFGWRPQIKIFTFDTNNVVISFADQR